MSPRLIFWISAFVRIFLVLMGAASAIYLWGPITGLVLGLIGMVTLFCVQLFYLQRLADWLDNPNSSRLPDGWGAWTDIFSRLYKLRRDDEKNQAELAEWLARFRQAMTLLPDGVVI
ncbi:MAG: DUF3329 domain-containing protein, partial [Burkholderiales bacterium]|nr:DUF3329 domain-containing protein [Burkholderiales bacterium]